MWEQNPSNTVENRHDESPEIKERGSCPSRSRSRQAQTNSNNWVDKVEFYRPWSRNKNPQATNNPLLNLNPNQESQDPSWQKIPM
jgi:hypothetical protein